MEPCKLRTIDSGVHAWSLSARPVFLDGLLYFRVAGSFQIRPCYPTLAGRAAKGRQAAKDVAPEEKAGRGWPLLLSCFAVALPSRFLVRWQEKQRDLHAAAVALGLATPSEAPPPDAVFMFYVYIYMLYLYSPFNIYFTLIFDFYCILN